MADEDKAYKVIISVYENDELASQAPSKIRYAQNFRTAINSLQQDINVAWNHIVQNAHLVDDVWVPSKEFLEEQDTKVNEADLNRALLEMAIQENKLDGLLAHSRSMVDLSTKKDSKKSKKKNKKKKK